ncbi:MAG TPA: class I SAM-dependent methyltransferase [bacterium]|nr:class I SAM-dependent methyltransferase [bacterium]
MNQSHKSFLSPEMIVQAIGVGEGERVADFGCGTGHLVLALARSLGPAGMVYAIDIDAEMVSSARSYVYHEGFRNAMFIHADLLKGQLTSIAKQSLDYIILSNLLHVLQPEDRSKVFCRAAEYLKPNGKLVVIDWEKQKSLLGPGLHLRVSAEDAKQAAAACAFSFEQAFDAGMYHYGLIFTHKPKKGPQKKQQP